jgi:ribosome-interacting GTPase 1
MSVLAKIKEIEDEMARTQKNKATNSHLGLLKARLAKLKSELVTQASAGGGGGSQEGTQPSSTCGFVSSTSRPCCGRMPQALR